MRLLVICPTFNRSKTVLDTVYSVINQTHTDWHLVIVDDCSTDNTKEILKPIVDSHQQISFIKNEENIGCYRSRNKGLKFSIDNNINWDVFTIFDSDDFCEPNRFKRVLSYFKSENDLGLTPKITRSMHRDLTFKIHKKEKQSDVQGTSFYTRKAFNFLGYFDNVRMGGDSEYNDRLKTLCLTPLGKKQKFKMLKMKWTEPLYVAYKTWKNNNLTYSGSTFRSNYMIEYGRSHKKMARNSGENFSSFYMKYS